jgi:hypothetical protein
MVRKVRRRRTYHTVIPVKDADHAEPSESIDFCHLEERPKVGRIRISICLWVSFDTPLGAGSVGEIFLT